MIQLAPWLLCPYRWAGLLQPITATVIFAAIAVTGDLCMEAAYAMENTPECSFGTLMIQQKAAFGMWVEGCFLNNQKANAGKETGIMEVGKQG